MLGNDALLTVLAPSVRHSQCSQCSYSSQYKPACDAVPKSAKRLVVGAIFRLVDRLRGGSFYRFHPPT